MSLVDIDNNLSTLRHVSNSWNLPPIPEQVQLDLATLPGMNPQTLSSFTFGISDEFETAQAPLPVELDPNELDPELVDTPSGTYIEPSSRGLVRWYGSLVGGQRPYELDDSSVSDWKRRAVEGGYVEMTPQEMESPLWRPEYNVINRQMASDQMERDFRGWSEGSVAIGELTHWLDDYLSPSGAMRAVIEADLFPDIPEVKEEYKTWGDKWRSFGRAIQDFFTPDWLGGMGSQGPNVRMGQVNTGEVVEKTSAGQEVVKKGIDAMTGPIDDVAIPILNWYLILQGWGNAAVNIHGLTRGAQAASKGLLPRMLSGSRNIRGPKGVLSPLGGIGRAFTPAQRFTTNAAGKTVLSGFSKPSGLSGLVGRKAPTLGKAMESWRGLRGVQAAKALNQANWRSGVSIRALGDVTGHNQPGSPAFSLEDVKAVEDWREEWLYPDRMRNIAIDLGIDVLFTPYNLLEPGTIKSAIRASGKGIQKFGYTTSALIPPLRKQLEKVKLGKNRTMNSVGRQVEKYLKDFYPDELPKFQQVKGEKGIGEAIAEVFFDGDAAKFGEAYVHANLGVAIDHAAKQATRHLVGSAEFTAEGMDWASRVYRAVRNQILAQVKYHNPHNVGNILSEMAGQHNPTNIKDALKGVENRDVINARRAKMVEEFLEEKSVTKARGLDVEEGWIRFKGVIDPETGTMSWKKVGKGEQLLDNDWVVDINKEEYAAIRGIDTDPELVDSIDDFFEMNTFFEFDDALIAVDGGRAYRWKKFRNGTARRWDPAKSRWLWDTGTVEYEDGNKYLGVVQNHNLKRDKTIVDLFENLESGADDILSPTAEQIPLLDAFPEIGGAPLPGYTDIVPAIEEFWTPEFIDRFANWDEYRAMYDELDGALSLGLLNEAKYLGAKSVQGRRLAFPDDRLDDRLAPYSADMFTDQANRYQYMKWINQGMYAPLVRSIDRGVGRFHLARIGTRTKQEALTYANMVNGRYNLLKVVQRIRRSPLANQVDEGIDQLIQTHGEKLTTKIIREYLHGVIEAETATGKGTFKSLFNNKRRGEYVRLVEDIQRMGGGTLADLENVLVKELTELSQSPDWVNRFGLPLMQVGGDTAMGINYPELARKRAKELVNASQFMAAEVDPSTLPDYLVNSLVDSGYKIVHGVEFQDPRELRNVIEELNVWNQKEISNLTLGFQRQNTQYLSQLRMRTMKGKLAARLQTAYDELEKMGVTHTPPRTEKVVEGTKKVTRERFVNRKGIRPEFASGDPNSEALRLVIQELWAVTKELQQFHQGQIDAVRGFGSWNMLAKGVTYAKASRTPFTVADLGRAQYNFVKKRLVQSDFAEGGIFSEDEFNAIWAALKESIKLDDGVAIRGLAHVEDYLRSRPTLLDMTQVLGKHKAGDSVKAPKTKTGAGRVLPWIGTYGGGQASYNVASSNDQPGEGWRGTLGNLAYSIPGALFGNMATKGLIRRSMGLVPNPTDFSKVDLDNIRNKYLLGNDKNWAVKGAVAGALGKGVYEGYQNEGDPSSILKGVAMGAGVGAGMGGVKGGRVWEALPWRSPEAVFNHTAWNKYAYLSDFGVNMRDYFRFSLSPIFDMSRYAEAVTLSHVVGNDVAKGLKLNQSPLSFKRGLAKKIRAEQGVSKEAAKNSAEARWKEIESEFANFGKESGDFDWENIENISKWFTSVGILGFSPQRWMASTFGQLLEAGIDRQTAYKTSREIYTYGMTGRSAAEQSVNIVFFPFSFMKKTVGHFAKYLSEDFSRAVVLHDMIKGYELADEKFNLGEFFEDRVPIMNKLGRLNLFNYGLSLGEFGGPNAPMIRGLWHTVGQPAEYAVAGALDWVGVDKETTMNSPLISALAGPVALSIKDEKDMEISKDVIRRMLPVWSDMQHLIGDAMEQAEVISSGITSDYWLTKQAQNERAWEEMNAAKTAVSEFLKSIGLPYSTVNRDAAQPLRDFLDAEEARIMDAYPSWGGARVDAAKGSIRREMEIDERIANATEGSVEELLAKFVLFETNEKMILKRKDPDIRWGRYDIDTVPPEFHTTMRELASIMVAIDPDFLRIYNQYYAREYGPIAKEIR